MKNAIRFILVVLFAFISVNAIGQSFLIKGGLSLSRISSTNFYVYDYGSYTNGSKPHLGAHLGISYEKKISDVFFLELGSMLSTKGVINMKWSPDEPYATKTSLVYLDIPILIKGYFELSDDVLLYNTIGPYLGFGLFGFYEDKNEEEDGTIRWDYAGDRDSRYEFSRYTRLDFGFSMGAGVDFKGVQVGFAYDFSLFNNIPRPDLSRDTRYLESSKHNIIRISLGYRFAKRSIQKNQNLLNEK